MKRQDIFTLLFTFFVGVCVGVYLYFAGFAGMFSNSSVSSVDESIAFSVIGEAYGGCRTSCASFLINADGSFRYLYAPSFGEPQVIESGTLPFALRAELVRALTPSSLTAQSQLIEPEFCDSFVDGVDIMYRVTRDNVTYTLDSCKTAVVTESALWQVLVKIRNYFETIEA